MPFLSALIALITLSSSFGLPGIVPGTPTECFIPGTPIEELNRATTVFAGKVVGRMYVTNDRPGQGAIGKRLIVRLEVERVWKGAIGKEVLMYTSNVRYPNGQTSMMEEDFIFSDGKEYLVYAFGQEGRLETSACTRTRELGKAGEDLKELGNGYEAQPGKVNE